MRMAIVGQETANGTPHYWYELKMSSQRGNMIMQALVPGWPYDQGQIAGMIMKAGDRPAMRLPSQMIGMMSRRPGGSSPARDLLKECTSAEVVGTESVTVPAGTFDALHLHATAGQQADVWVSPDVPFGLVRMKGADGEMELTGKGTDATSSITETPQGM